ncbi:hypothetical protein ACFSQQ_16445 [Mesorhizobium kowhaii]|uniref:hypothetical protein n=1 Tax=Mesorhizobium kowhaii TaxID=1300272 RepID=UPI0035ECC849
MSAIYSLAFQDRIVILSDGAVYDADGVVCELASKVWVAGHAPFAVTGNGNWDLQQCHAEAIVHLASVDTAIDYLEIQLSIAKRRRLDATALANGAGILVAGYSQTKGFRQVYAPFHNLDPRFEPLELVEVEEFSATPMISDAGAAAFERILADLESMGAEFFSDRGADLFEVLRQERTSQPGAAGYQHLVGGHVDLTMVYMEGVATKRLRQWPDTIGQKIRPKQAAPQ